MSGMAGQQSEQSYEQAKARLDEVVAALEDCKQRRRVAYNSVGYQLTVAATSPSATVMRNI